MDGSTISSSKGGPDSAFNDNLIREVRQNPIIYDFSHPLYGNAIKKQETWSEIAANLNEKVEAVKTRWRTLRDRYTKERRRVMTCGVGSSFSYYSDLCFLDNFYAENRFCIENRVTPSKRNSSNNNNNNIENNNNNIATIHNDATASMLIKPEIFEQQPSNISNGCNTRTGGEFPTEQEETDTLSSFESERRLKKKHTISKVNHKSPTPPICSATTLATATATVTAAETAEPITIEKIPSKRSKLDSSSDSLPDNAVVQALMRSAEALQRLAERKSVFDHAVAGPRDADECFADFVCMSLKSIDNGSRVHARIAILHALAQFQT